VARLDHIDLKILAALQRNGRIRNSELVELVNLSASPCLQRMKRLESEGFIRSYGAEIDLSKLGDALTVFTEVTLSGRRGQDFKTFEAGIAGFQQVVECHLISGGYDYLVKFLCRSILDYQACVEEILAADLGIEKYFSYVVIKSPIPPRPADITRFVRQPGGQS
jgi:DNA-binding Lrp family transcriptional regulator